MITICVDIYIFCSFGKHNTVHSPMPDARINARAVTKVNKNSCYQINSLMNATNLQTVHYNGEDWCWLQKVSDIELNSVE